MTAQYFLTLNKMIVLERIYDKENKQGYRILVDRLWPRGVRKEDLNHDLWLKEAAPSDALRKKFHHESERWESFEAGYRQELSQKPEIIEQLKRLEKEKGTLVFLYSAKNSEQNNAIVLKAVVEGT